MPLFILGWICTFATVISFCVSAHNYCEADAVMRGTIENDWERVCPEQQAVLYYFNETWKYEEANQ